MKKFAFISRHTPTELQVKMAEEKGIELIHVGDEDAFGGHADWEKRGYKGAVVVNPALACRMISDTFHIGVFESQRIPDGQVRAGEYIPKRLHLYRVEFWEGSGRIHNKEVERPEY